MLKEDVERVCSEYRHEKYEKDILRNQECRNVLGVSGR
jgi:hypothetical protein